MRYKYDLISILASLLVLSAIAVACSDKGDSDLAQMPPPQQPVAVSPQPKIKFKGHRRWRNDLARALALDEREVCNEMGQYSCTELVHRIALGGSAAEDLGFYTPLPTSTITSPIAADRVALSACIKRVDLDLQSQEPVIFTGPAPMEDGHREEIIHALYRRLIQREAAPHEVTYFVELLYRDVTSLAPEVSLAASARDWAVLSCFVVATSMESLFY